MLNYIVQGEPYYNTPQNVGNINLESNWPQVSGSTSAPQLLYYVYHYVYRRILYVNSGGSPLWSPLAQLYPTQVLQTLSQPLLNNVIAQLRTAPYNPPDLQLATLLTRGF
jgi:hypothetical protein